MCILNNTYFTFKLRKELQICKTGKDGMHVRTSIPARKKQCQSMWPAEVLFFGHFDDISVKYQIIASWLGYVA